MGDNQENDEGWEAMIDKFLGRGNAELRLDKIELGTFEADPNAALKTAHGVRLDYIDDKTKPSLLLSNLGVDAQKESSAYKYISKNTTKGPCAFFATSGAGKTRRLLEFLSHNYGLYFLASSRGQDHGSTDFQSSLNHLNHILESPLGDGYKLPDTADSKEFCERTTKQNYNKVNILVNKLVESRIAVFMYVQKKIGRRPTPYEWLLLQLFPQKFFGDRDIFNQFFNKRKRKELNDDPNLHDFDVDMHCFIDEAQKLKDQLRKEFFSMKMMKEDKFTYRSAYSAYLKGFLAASEDFDFLKFPLFCGTGFSYEDLREETESVAGKPSYHVPLFKDFDTFCPADVEQYMKGIVNLDGIQDDLIEHTSKWLRGRPRWTAFFLEIFLEQKDKNIGFLASRGNFQPEEGAFIRSLDRYIERMTSEEGADISSARGVSWTPGSHGAYGIMRSLAEKGLSGAAIDARSALFGAANRFVLTGKSQHVHDKSAKLIQLGIASVVVEVKATGFVKCQIDEPIIIQACVNIFGLRKVLQLNMMATPDASGRGAHFENFLLPQLQLNWKKVIENELNGDAGEFEDYEVPTLTSYGVLSKDCNSPKETLSWLEKANKARFEGTVEPFCKPDSLMGPDLLSLLRNQAFQKKLLGVQTKLRYDVNQLEALRTIQPSMFYCERRQDPQPKLNRNLTEEEKQLWVETQNSLLSPRQDVPPRKARRTSRRVTARKRTEPIVRMLVQFPATRSRNSASGLVKFQDTTASSKKATAKKATAKKAAKGKTKSDALLVIDRNNAECLFDAPEKDLLMVLKVIDEDCPDTFENNSQEE